MPARQLAIGTHGCIKLRMSAGEVESTPDTERIHDGKATDVSFCLI